MDLFHMFGLSETFHNILILIAPNNFLINRQQHHHELAHESKMPQSRTGRFGVTKIIRNGVMNYDETCKLPRNPLSVYQLANFEQQRLYYSSRLKRIEDWLNYRRVAQSKADSISQRSWTTVNSLRNSKFWRKAWQPLLRIRLKTMHALRIRRHQKTFDWNFNWNNLVTFSIHVQSTGVRNNQHKWMIEWAFAVTSGEKRISRCAAKMSNN